MFHVFELRKYLQFASIQREIQTNQARRYITVREALTGYEKKYISDRNVYDTILYSQYDLTYTKIYVKYMYVGENTL